MTQSLSCCAVIATKIKQFIANKQKKKTKKNKVPRVVSTFPNWRRAGQLGFPCNFSLASISKQSITSWQGVTIPNSQSFTVVSYRIYLTKIKRVSLLTLIQDPQGHQAGKPRPGRRYILLKHNIPQERRVSRIKYTAQAEEIPIFNKGTWLSKFLKASLSLYVNRPVSGGLSLNLVRAFAQVLQGGMINQSIQGASLILAEINTATGDNIYFQTRRSRGGFDAKAAGSTHTHTHTRNKNKVSTLDSKQSRQS